MNKLVRFGVSIEKDLHDKFNEGIKKLGYENRSEAIRDLMRNSFVEDKWNRNSIVVGGISIVYDHHKRELLNKIMDLQHNYHEIIISTQHVHLTHNDCLEILITKGKSQTIKGLYGKIKALKGVGHVSIMQSGILSEIIKLDEK